MPPALKRRQPPGPVARFFAKVGDYDLLAVFDPKRPRPCPRTVLVNVALPPHALESQPRFAVPFTGKNKVGLGKRAIPAEGWIFESNQVLTSKYNIITFLPRNLLEQFRRVANVFFLGQSTRFSLATALPRLPRHRSDILYLTPARSWRKSIQIAVVPLLTIPRSPRNPPILPPVLHRIPRPRRIASSRRSRRFRPQGWLRGSQTTSVRSRY